MTSFRPAVADMQAAKTHCPQGHEYTPENTGRQQYNRADGSVGIGRACKICRRAAVQRFHAAHPGYFAAMARRYYDRRIARAEGGSE